MTEDVQVGEVIQATEGHKWAGCLLIVDAIKAFGVQAYVPIPNNDGTPPGSAFIRLSWDEFEPLGVLAPLREP